MPSSTIALGGMGEGLVAQPGVAELVSNLYRDPEGMWVVMPGTVPLLTEAPGSGAISSLAWFNPRPNQRWLVYERVASATTSGIRVLNIQSQTSDLIVTRRRIGSADPGSLFAESNRWLYVFSPVDAPLRWNGLWTSPVGFVQAAPEPVVSGPDQGFDFVDITDGNVAGGTFKIETSQRGVGPYPGDQDEPFKYGYAVTMMNELGQESPMSAMAFVSGTNSDAASGGRHLISVAIPRMPEHVRGCRLYRTKNLIDSDTVADDFPVYLVESFTLAGGIDYIDHTPDEELVNLFNRDSVGPVPIGARAAAFWQGHLWLGGAPDDPTRLRYSQPLLQEQFPAINYLQIGSSRTGPIVAVAPLPRALAVFKTGGVYLVRGNAADGYRVDTVSERHGTNAPRAIEYIQGLGLVFLDSSGGPHVLDDNAKDDRAPAVTRIPGIRKVWRERVGPYGGNLARSACVYQADFNELWFQVPQGGDTRPSLGLVFHLDIQQWSIREDWTISCFARALGRTWVGSWDDTGGNQGVHLLTFGSMERPDGVDVTGVYQVGFLQFPRAAPTKSVEVWGRALGPTSTLQLETQVDRRPRQAGTTTGKPQKLNSSAPDVWGLGVWSEDLVWGDYHLDRFRIATRMLTGRELGLRFESDAMAIHALRIETVDGTDIEPEVRP